MTTNFRKKYCLEDRRKEAVQILQKYPDRIPIIVEEDKNSDIKLDKRKFLVPRDFTLGQFIFILRKRITTITPEKSLFVFINNILPPNSYKINTLYDNYKENDLFLYFVVSTENTFGR